MQVKYYGSFATTHGHDERAFSVPITQLVAKMQANPEAFSIITVSFTSSGVVLEDRGGSGMTIPGNMLTLADKLPNPNFFAVVALSPDRTYFLCHIFSAYRVSTAGTIDFLADGCKRLIKKDPSV